MQNEGAQPEATGAFQAYFDEKADKKRSSMRLRYEWIRIAHVLAMPGEFP